MYSCTIGSEITLSKHASPRHLAQGCSCGCLLYQDSIGELVVQ